MVGASTQERGAGGRARGAPDLGPALRGAFVEQLIPTARAVRCRSIFVMPHHHAHGCVLSPRSRASQMVRETSRALGVPGLGCLYTLQSDMPPAPRALTSLARSSTSRSVSRWALGDPSCGHASGAIWPTASTGRRPGQPCIRQECGLEPLRADAVPGAVPTRSRSRRNTATRSRGSSCGRPSGAAGARGVGLSRAPPHKRHRRADDHRRRPCGVTGSLSRCTPETLPPC